MNLIEHDGNFPSWWTNPIWLFFKDYFANRIFLVSVLVFAGYWGVPFVLSIFYDSLYSSSINSPTDASPLPYLEDVAHLFFAMTISVGGAVTIYTLNRMPAAIQTLCSESVLKMDTKSVQELYYKNRKLANGLLPKFISLAAAIVTGYFFYMFFSSPEYAYWWGNKAHGFLNIYFVFVEIAMIYFGTLIIILYGVYSKFLVQVLDEGIKPKVYHHDDSNGLGALGKIIVLKWLVALFIILAVLIVLYFGYLGIEETILTRFLIGLFALAIPVVAILPLAKSLKEIKQVKIEKLKLYGSLLNRKLEQLEKHATNDDFDQAKKSIDFFVGVQQIFNEIYKMNVFPFDPKALATVIFVYGFQIGATVYMLFKV